MASQFPFSVHRFIELYADDILLCNYYLCHPSKRVFANEWFTTLMAMSNHFNSRLHVSSNNCSSLSCLSCFLYYWSCEWLCCIACWKSHGLVLLFVRVDQVPRRTMNHYYGWYQDTGQLETIPYQLSANLKQWRKRYQLPFILTEYGADTVAGLHSVSDLLRASNCFPVVYK